MASSRSRSDSNSSDASIDEDYFFRPYIPLSNLPTPPLTFSSNDCSRQYSPALFPPDEYLDPRYLGPAIHLTNLIPSPTTRTTPSTPLVHAILTRAALPLETVALAVCILDSLNSRFASPWRQSFPITPQSSQIRRKKSYVDSIHSELIVLSALILAVKFVDDEQDKTISYAEELGKNMWTCEQVNYTQRLILENLSYRLLPLWEEGIIAEAIEEMERARRQTEGQAQKKLKAEMQSNIYPAEPAIWDSEWDTETCCGSFESKPMSDGKTILGGDDQLTSALTPTYVALEENIRALSTRDVKAERRTAFEGYSMDERLELPHRSLEPFPRYVEPVMEGAGVGY